MRQHELVQVSFQARLLGWLIHAFTASGAFVGLLALLAIYQHQPTNALWLMGIAIVIDAVDGFFARAIHIKRAVPSIDGALLDNIVDFFNYTLVPAFFILIVPVVPESLRFVCVMIMTFSSAFQFTQVDAKTIDHFFKGFPSYWNIAVFYLFFWQMDPWVNAGIIFVLGILSFVPIKYIYPSRLDFLTRSRLLKIAMLLSTVLWGISTAVLLWLYPKSNHALVMVSIAYVFLYAGISFYRTWVPLEQPLV